MRIDKKIIVVMERLGPVLVDALLSISPVDGDERLGPVLVDALLSIPPADGDERLGPVLVDALLSIPPANIDGKAGAGIGGCFALYTASEY